MNLKFTLLAVVFSSWAGLIAAQSSHNGPRKNFAREFEDHHLSLRTLRLMKREADARVALLGRAVENLENKLGRRGTVPDLYKIDEETYLRKIKPRILQAFEYKHSDFKSLCGENPDFVIDGHGMATVKTKTEECNNKKFPAVDMHAILVVYHVNA